MDDVDSLESLDLRQVEAEGLERAFEFALGPVGDFGPGLCAANVQVVLIRLLWAPAMYLDLDLLCQFAAQVIDVNAGASVHQRWVFACE